MRLRHRYRAVAEHVDRSPGSEGSVTSLFASSIGRVQLGLWASGWVARAFIWGVADDEGVAGSECVLRDRSVSRSD
jgi:hypothetical protein